MILELNIDEKPAINQLFKVVTIHFEKNSNLYQIMEICLDMSEIGGWRGTLLRATNGNFMELLEERSRVMKVNTSHPLGTESICTEFHVNPLNGPSYRDILAWTRMVYQMHH